MGRHLYLFIVSPSVPMPLHSAATSNTFGARRRIALAVTDRSLPVWFFAQTGPSVRQNAGGAYARGPRALSARDTYAILQRCDAALELFYGDQIMRIDGTYTFAGGRERVFAAITDADLLTSALPSCERLLQLGPAGADGTVAFEARLRGESGVTSITVRVGIARRPTWLRLELRGYGSDGPFSGAGSIDLVERERHTVVAYALDVEVPSTSGDRQRALAAQVGRYLSTACERLSRQLLDEQEAVDHMVAVQTPRGRIVALRAAAREPALAFGASEWTQRALWMGTGMLLGISAVGLTLGLLRRIEHRGE